MKRLIALFIAPALLAFSALPALAQEGAAGPSSTLTQARLSPHDTVNLRVTGGRIILNYGRPFTIKPGTDAARTVWGGDLVPFGKIWRLGSDEATLLITPKALTFKSASHDVTLLPGTYSLYLLPESMDQVSLVINRQFGQWGLEYHQDLDLVRVPLTRSAVAKPAHQFEMALDKSPTGGVIKLRWEDTEFSAPFAVGK